ncbi:MAG: serine/threonine protein kinase [Deltaproteobacteria bacterium]|nr:serine/threonine protein kinase [Deltaproteobacteria bacterium]
MTTCPCCSADLELDATFCGACGRRARVRRVTLVGTQLGDPGRTRYRVDAKLAEGGFGAIYRATALSTGHEVALKVLHDDLANDPSLAARFRREGAMLESLRHPHTVTTYEVGETKDGTLYIAMELLRGESLHDRFLASGPLPWQRVLTIVKAVCQALGEAHALGIVHRDLKPANIHLEDDDFVKVLDFGIAKLMQGSTIDDGTELTRVGQAIGTLEYMAPEQMIGGTCDGRTDIYALGLVAYEMLTGERPFSDATGPTSLITALMTQPVRPPSSRFGCSGLAPEVDELVLRCLQRDPANRFASVGALIAAIDHVLELAPLARGSWSAEVDELTEVDELAEDATWIDAIPPISTPRPVAVPSPVPSPLPRAAAAHLQLAHEPLRAPYAFRPQSPKTDPYRARFREPTPFRFDVEGSRVGAVPTPPGMRATIEPVPPPSPLAPPLDPVTSPSMLAPAEPAVVTPPGSRRVVRFAVWALSVLAVGAGLGLTLAAVAP